MDNKKYLEKIKGISHTISLPYIKELNHYGITEEGEILEILSYIFGKELKRRKNTGRWFALTDEENRVIYGEVISPGLRDYPLGTWMVYKFEDDRFPKKWTKQITSNGDVITKEYREDGDVHSTSYGEMEKMPTRITESVDKDRHKRFMDAVLKHFVDATSREYDEEYDEVLYNYPFYSFPTYSFYSSAGVFDSFCVYASNHFGLTYEEMEYIWNKYVDVFEGKY